MADFCMNPVDNIDGLIPASVYNVTSYYVSCKGTNPLMPYLNSMFSFTNNYYSSIQALMQTDPSCTNNVYLTDSLLQLQNMNSTIINMNYLGYCPPIQDFIENVLQDGLCNWSFHGMYTIWIGQYICTSFVLFVTIVIAYLYQYFGEDLLLDAVVEAGKGDKDSADDEENDDDEEATNDVEKNFYKGNKQAINSMDNMSIELERPSQVITYQNNAYEPDFNPHSVSSDSKNKKWKARNDPNEEYAVTSAMHDENPKSNNNNSEGGGSGPKIVDLSSLSPSQQIPNSSSLLPPDRSLSPLPSSFSPPPLERNFSNYSTTHRVDSVLLARDPVKNQQLHAVRSSERLSNSSSTVGDKNSEELVSKASITSFEMESNNKS
jgi:hypothetical protein